MLHRIHERYLRIEQQRFSIINRLDFYTPEELNYKPHQNSWSLNQVISHLIQSEEKSVAYILNKISTPENSRNTGIINHIKSVLLTFILRMPLKYKIPNKANVAPPKDELVLQDIFNRWENCRIELRMLLNDMQPEQTSLAVFKHPVTGNMNICQYLDFLFEHIQHHEKQMQRIIKSLSEKTNN